jgi:hypothetical protein
LGIRFDGPVGYSVDGRRAIRIERADGRSPVPTSSHD